MGKRYFAEVVTSKGVRVRMEIWNSSYVGAAKEMVVVADTFVIEQGRESLFDSITTYSGSIRVISETNFEYTEMLLDNDLDNIVLVYENNSLIFSGYIENGVYEEEYVAPPYDVNIAFTDGLKKLNGLFLDTDALLNQMHFNMVELIRICLTPILLPDQNGNKYLYINSSLINEGFNNAADWTCFEQTFLHVSALTGDSVSFYTVLENILRVFGATIYQHNGSWYIERIKNKLHDGNVSFVRYNIGEAYSAVNNRGAVVGMAGRLYQVESGERYITDTPRLTIEKEYGTQEIGIDITKKESLVSNNYNLNKQRVLGSYYIPASFSYAEYYTVKMLYSNLPTFSATRAPYVWYWASDIQKPGHNTMPVDVVKNFGGITNGIKFTHKDGNNFYNHVHNETPCHVLFGSTISFKMKVAIDFTADKITKKTWVIIHMKLNQVAYINTTDFPYGHSVDCPGVVPCPGSMAGGGTNLQHGQGDLNNDWTTPRTWYNDNPNQLGGLPLIYLCYNSDDNTDMFNKWYNGEIVEVEFTINNSGWLNEGSIDNQQRLEVTLFPALFCDDPKLLPSNDAAYIRSSAFGDIIVDLNVADALEDGYSIKNMTITEGKYHIKRSAPPIELKYIEGPPLYDHFTTGDNVLLSCFYTNFQLKYLLLSPNYNDIYTKDSAGNITGFNMIDGISMNINITNTRNFSWYDKVKPLDDYNKKGLLIERLAQDRFDCYAKARKVLDATVNTIISPTMLDIYKVSHLPTSLFIATRITRNVEADDYGILLEEVRDRVVTTSLFIPRNEAKNPTPNIVIPDRGDWIM